MLQNAYQFVAAHLDFICAVAALVVSESMALTDKVKANGLLDAAFKAAQKRGEGKLDQAKKPLN